MGGDFILHFVSNASPDIYPDNTTSGFQTELPRRITLNGTYECALLEIQLPSTISNVAAPDNTLTVKSKKDGNLDTLTVTPGYYANRKFLIDALNRTFKEKKIVGGNIFDLKADGLVQTNTTSGHIISLSETLRRQLGLSTSEIDTEKTYFGSWPVDPEIGAPSAVYVYADFVAPQIVGHSLVPLLRTVPTRKGGIFGASVTHSVENPVYVDVSTHELARAEIYLRDHTGSAIPFLYGHSSLLVHFRKRV